MGNPRVTFGVWLFALWLLKSEPSQYDFEQYQVYTTVVPIAFPKRLPEKKPVRYWK